jgi:tight adherence protein B
MILLFSILLALAVGLGAAGVVLERGGAGARALADRLRRVGGPADLAPLPGVERDVRYSAIPWFDKALRRLNLGEGLELLLYQAGMTMRAGVMVTLTAAFAMGGYLFGVIVFHRLLPGLVCMGVFGPLPYLYVLYRKHSRMQAFRAAFPDALDLLVSGLRAGLSFSAALQIVSEESPEPLRSEFAITVEEQALGLEMREALTNLTQRVEVLELRFFVMAVLLQRETGGNLAEVLSNSAALIRDRFRVLGDIQTFTAQGKLTAVVLVLLPIGIGLFTFMVTPEYFAPMIQSEGGRTALWLAALLQLAGCFVIYRIVNIRV